MPLGCVVFLDRLSLTYHQACLPGLALTSGPPLLGRMAIFYVRSSGSPGGSLARACSAWLLAVRSLLDSWWVVQQTGHQVWPGCPSTWSG